MLKINKQKFKFIYIEITEYCNLACPFCPSKDLKVRKTLKIDDFKLILEKIKGYTNTVYLHILGEPLLHKDFEKIVKLCDEYHLKVRLTTNGTLVKNYDFSKLKLNKINISLQALVNSTQTKIDEYFENINQMLISLKDKLTKGEVGIDFRLWNDKSNNEIVEKNNYLIKKLKEDLKIDTYHNIHISIEDEFDWPNEDTPTNEDVVRCLGGKTQLGILTNMDVVLCCLDYEGKTKLGNLKNSSLQEILDDEPYQKAMNQMFQGKPYFKICECCKYRNKFTLKRGDARWK